MAISRSFELHEFTADRLYESLSNELCPTSEVAHQKRAVYLLGYLRDIGAQTIVVERNYTDRDYLDDYAAYYVRCFREYQRRCKRLHFFSIALSSERFLQMVRGELSPDEEKEICDAYLGFVVARPLPDAIVGRTILKAYESDGGRRNYTCTLDYHANLFGINLTVRSLAFQEQDTVLAACATVALWCCFNKTRELFGSQSPTPAEITRTANQVVHHARPIPSHGLIVQQICNAIRQVGLEPEVIQVKPHTPLSSLIYGHLAMGLPVILGVEIEGRGGHAVTLTGYSLQQQRHLSREVADGAECIEMTGLRINEFYAHDDQTGPFSRLKIKPGGKGQKTVYPVVFEGDWRDKKTGEPVALYPDVVIVPVYNKIRVTFIEVQKWLTRFSYVFSVFVQMEGQPEWDVQLGASNDYKRSIKEVKGVSADLLERLLVGQHPRFIWRAILKLGGMMIVEFLFDATDMDRSLPAYEAIWHHKQVKILLQEKFSSAELQDAFTQVLSPSFLKFLRESVQQP